MPFSYQGNLIHAWQLQFDAEVDTQGIIHLIADQYYQFDLKGRMLSTEPQAQDLQGYSLSYPPSIALDPQGNAHILLRGPGSFDSGFDIHYRLRLSDGSWPDDSHDYLLSDTEKRNYVVGITALSENEVYAYTTAGGPNIWGDVRFWAPGAQSAQALGKWSGIWRADLDARMRSHNGKVYFASANGFTSDDIFFSIANAGPDLLNNLKQNVKTHHAGSGKKGNPDIAVDQSGNAHLVYGARQEVYYNQYRADGRKVFAEDQRLLSDTGNWHLGFGMSSIAVSDDGRKILVSGLKTQGDKEANNSSIVLIYSLDSGKTWSEAITTGQLTHGGEGRMRPRLLSYRDQFMILYFDSRKIGISMATIDMSRLKNLHPGAAISAISLLLSE